MTGTAVQRVSVQAGRRPRLVRAVYGRVSVLGDRVAEFLTWIGDPEHCQQMFPPDFNMFCPK
jgi:hypothetical protein